MYEGMNPETLHSTLVTDYKERKDYAAPVSKISFKGDPDTLAVAGLPGGLHLLNSWSEGQVVDFFGVPRAYWRRMQTLEPAMAMNTLNTWARHTEYSGQKRLIRTVGGIARAWLSDSYRCLNNIDLAASALPILASKGAIVRSAAVTETRLYIKAVLPTLEAKVTKSTKRGDVLRGGVLLKNSEVGNGALDIAIFVERLLCVNGLIGESLFRKTHLGRRLDVGEQAMEVFTERTKRLDDASFWSKVRDVLNAALQPKYIEQVAAKANAAAGDQIPDPTKVDAIVEDVTARYALPEATRAPILKHLIEGGDLSRWGLLNAVTASADNVDDYELATALEEAGGKIIDLTRDDWRDMTKAA